MGIGGALGSSLGKFKVKDGCDVEAGSHFGEGVGRGDTRRQPGPSLWAALLSSSGAACS